MSVAEDGLFSQFDPGSIAAAKRRYLRLVMRVASWVAVNRRAPEPREQSKRS